MCYVNSKREAGRLAEWKEKLWGRRYRAIVVSNEEEAQVERLTYLLSNGMKENLVEHLKDWPGAHSVGALLDGGTLKGTWFDRTQEYAARSRGEEFEPRKYATSQTLTLSPLPSWSHLPPEVYRERVAHLVEEIEAKGIGRVRKQRSPAARSRGGPSARSAEQAGSFEEIPRPSLPRISQERPL